MPANSYGPTATLALKAGAPATTATDALVVATYSGSPLRVEAPGLTKAQSAKIAKALSAVGATGSADEVVKVPGTGLASATMIVGVGLGSESGVTNERLRRAAGAATRQLAGVRRVALALPVSDQAQATAVLEGAALGAYSFSTHRHATLGKSKAPVRSITLLHPSARSWAQAGHRAHTIAHNVNFARDLINTSPLHLPPAELAAQAKSHLAGTGVKVSVMDEKALAAGGYGGILGVGQGSTRPPRLVRMEYRPTGAKRHVVLIGKGITFDTGGISLKPPAGMHEMKGDMSGAAAVVATIRAVADLGLPINVTAYAACAENMPGGGAQRPGDVITIYGGKTVEVLNTDAEGRLVMADVLVRAAEDKPDVVIDISTLTGACVVALGHRTAGVMGDPAIRDAIKAAADRVGEDFWPLPMPEHLRPTLDSTVADIANIGIREGGTLSAALFLSEFVKDGLPWAHLDIAGPAFHDKTPYGYTHKGGVGFGVRTMLGFVEDVLAGTVVTKRSSRVEQ